MSAKAWMADVLTLQAKIKVRSMLFRATPLPTPPRSRSQPRPSARRASAVMAKKRPRRPSAYIRAMLAPAPRDIRQAAGRGRLMPKSGAPAKVASQRDAAASRRVPRASQTPAGPSTPDGAATAPSVVRGATDGPLPTQRVHTHLPDAAPASPLKELDTIVGGQRLRLRQLPHGRTPFSSSSAPTSSLPPPTVTTGATRRCQMLSSSSGAAQRYFKGFHLDMLLLTWPPDHHSFY